MCAVGSTFLLYAAGLGRAESAATASAINWIVKDGIGQAGAYLRLQPCSKLMPPQLQFETE